MKIVAPVSTLVQSPAFSNAVDEANAEFGDWIAECRTYEATTRAKVSAGLAGVVGKYTAGVVDIAELEQLREAYDQINEMDVLSRKAAARALIRRKFEIMNMSNLNSHQ